MCKWIYSLINRTAVTHFLLRNLVFQAFRYPETFSLSIFVTVAGGCCAKERDHGLKPPDPLFRFDSSEAEQVILNVFLSFFLHYLPVVQHLRSLTVYLIMLISFWSSSLRFLLPYLSAYVVCLPLTLFLSFRLLCFVSCLSALNFSFSFLFISECL